MAVPRRLPGVAAPARAREGRCRADGAGSHGVPGAAVGGRGGDGGGIDQQPEGEGRLLGDDAIVMDSSLSQKASYLSSADLGS